MKMTGAEILCETLTRLGVRHIFGYPGGAILPVYDALGKSKLHHILVRHEQGATHMADGYARATGGIGVAMATSGPGATNMVTGIATAMLDSSPVVCITGQVSSKVLGSDAFQEVDITGITMPITKYNVVVNRAEDIARTLREAFIIAQSGRPGPVLVDFTKDAQQASAEFDWDACAPNLPVKRIRNNDCVNVTPCKMDGTPVGIWVGARAREVPDVEVSQRVNALLDKKYRLMRRLFSRRLTREGRQEIILEIKVNE